MIYVYVQAQFAAFRTFTAGWYRPTASFMTHSAAYGLLLNLAGVESRLREGDAGHDEKTPATLTRPGLPPCEIALGVPIGNSQDDVFPRIQSVYQQLHNYPVGTTGKGRADDCRGNKYNITPVRREFLSGLKVIIACRAPAGPDLEVRIRGALAGQTDATRYGLPFLGDNSFLPDRIDEVSTPARISWFEERDDVWQRTHCQSVRWYENLGPEIRKAQLRATRLTIQIDRANLSESKSALFAPGHEKTAEESRLIQLGYQSNRWNY